MTDKDPFKAPWKQVDSLKDAGLPRSAVPVIRQILKDAKKAGDVANQIKAQLFLFTTEDEYQDRTQRQTLDEVLKLAETTAGVEQALWSSISAELLWIYYEQNRWQILERTAVAADNPDYSTWTARDFFEQVAQLHRQALRPADLLKATPVEAYAAMVIEGENTRHLRPTLYDLLAARALTFFANEEKDLVRPAYAFQLREASLYNEALDFSRLNLLSLTRDTQSLHLQALLVYQELIRFHEGDQDPAALIDWDLNRLEFIHQHSVHPEKDSLYLNALQRLEQRYAAHPGSAMAGYRIALQLMQGEEETGAMPLRGRIEAREEGDLLAAKAKLEAVIKKFPDSEGGIYAENTLQQLLLPELAMEAESGYLPEEAIKILVRYRNAPKVTFSLYRVDNDPFIRQERNFPDEEDLSGMAPLSVWERSLPGTEDLKSHTTEIKVDALQSGAYVLVATLPGQEADRKAIVASVRFQVTALSLVKTSASGAANQFFALNRKSGAPVAGARLLLYTQEWDSKIRKSVYKLKQELRTDQAGSAKSPDNGFYEYAYLIAGKDTLQEDGISLYTYPTKQPAGETRVFLFTDRALYRPGQTIYFKGIKVRRKAGKSQVVPNLPVTVTFYDANGQTLEIRALRTNDAGSFSGTFVAPESGLTGRMRIATDRGSVAVSVEEYKRPRFFAAIDSLKGEYHLNQEVDLSGTAETYAGSKVDGAAFTYRVVRTVRFPFYWARYQWGGRYFPQQTEEMEIANGSGQTDASGRFNIRFKTLADPGIDRRTLPVFTYRIYVDVTDLNGETRSTHASLQAGYRSLQIIASVDPQSKASALDTLRVTTQNLNGLFVPATLQVQVAALKFPGKIYRERLWEQPDQYVLSEAEFRKYFPDDEYQSEGDYQNWEAESPVFSASMTTRPEGFLTLPASAWKRGGWHMITLEGKDKEGQPLKEKLFTYVVDKPVATQQLPLVITSNAKVYQPGDKAVMELRSGFEPVYLLELSSIPDRSVRMEQLRKKGYTASKTIAEADRGGQTFSWIFVKNNRFYTATAGWQVPWPSKELQLEWATHRDKLLPGAEETWTLTLKGEKKEIVAAEVLAGLYDASLDAFLPHLWSWDNLQPYVHRQVSWNTYGFGSESSRVLSRASLPSSRNYVKTYDRLDIPYPAYETRYYSNVLRRTAGGRMAADEVMEVQAMAPEADAAPAPEASAKKANVGETSENANTDQADGLRTNLQETAFFFPHLQTDSAGNVQFSFQIPEALTTWKFMAFAHTPQWETGYLEGKVRTQKDLMVQPNLPRFFRQKDELVLSTKITNLSAGPLEGQARIEIMDAFTLQPLNAAFGLANNHSAFSAAAGRSTTASWTIRVPESRYQPVVVRISAKAGNFTDGEESALPVITNRMLVTETVPLAVRGNAEKDYDFTALLENKSNSLVHQGLTVEFTGNPAWYAVQALPYLMEYPHDCAEQLFNRFYANALAGHIVSQSPKIKEVFTQWETLDTDALLSNLEKNQELKTALLAETPWLREAESESAQKKRIALLFQNHKLSKELNRNLRKLEQMQLGEGGFGWFKGMQSNRYITQYIVTGLARLRHLNVEAADVKRAYAIIERALPYLDRALEKDYQSLLEHKADLKKQHIGQLQVQYLYMRSFFPELKAEAGTQKAINYYSTQAAAFWNKFNPYMQGMIALGLNRLNDKATPEKILASLKERAVRSEEMGMYWDQAAAGYWWYQAPISGQAMLVEAFTELKQEQALVEDLKTWLIKQKQTQNWGTTVATADAVYALLLSGTDWLVNAPLVTISLGDTTLRSDAIRTEAGTGYFKHHFPGASVNAKMGNIRVAVQHADPGTTAPAWGGVYWQYFEDLDKIQGAATPLSLEKELYRVKNTDRGPELQAITAEQPLKVGDRVQVRIILRSDRDMEYLHLKDLRAACFEPENVLSGYRFKSGLGYYESTLDVSSNFFIDYLTKGTYVFEYTVFVAQAGSFSGGVTSIQCMYAPEFSSHSEGERIRVEAQ